MLPQKKKRMEGGGRKATLPDVEDELLVWIDEMRAKNQQVMRSSIQQKALNIFRKRGEASNFTASSYRGWLEKVCRQHQLSLLRRSQSKVTFRFDPKIY